jgi:preprotein translocase subunit YajC
MGKETAAAAALEAQNSSMVTLFGVTFNIYGAILIVIFSIFLIAIYRAQRARRFDWMDMITRDGTKVSATKMLQLIGGIVATFIVIKLTMQGQLNWDIFAIYLAYVASIDGFSKFMLAKYGATISDDSAVGTTAYDRRYGKRQDYVGSDGYQNNYNNGQILNPDNQYNSYNNNQYNNNNGQIINPNNQYNNQYSNNTQNTQYNKPRNNSPEIYAEFQINGGAKANPDNF